MLQYLVIVHPDHHDRRGLEPVPQNEAASLGTASSLILTCLVALNSMVS